MTSTAMALLWLHLAAAVFLDLRERRIPNPLIVSGLLGGMAVSFIHGGLPGLGTAALGAVAGMLSLIPFFLLGVLGAGDAKLAGVVGTFTGPAALLPIGFYTVLAGGLLGMVVLLATGGVGSGFANVRQQLLAITLRAQGVPIGLADAPHTRTARLPYAIAIAIGVAIWAATRS